MELNEGTPLKQGSGRAFDISLALQHKNRYSVQSSVP
jgi:hypothetical protein